MAQRRRRRNPSIRAITRKAAQALVANLLPLPGSKTDWDASPIILLYRQAVELHLKGVVDQGNHFVASPTDPLTLHKTHSLQWLAQLICKIIKAVRWKSTFKCAGLSSMADFSALMNELEEMDPISYAIYTSKGKTGGAVPPQFQPANVIALARKLDARMDLLEVTAKTLAATWALQQDTNSHSTIQ